jgi:cyanophycin synthetase
MPIRLHDLRALEGPNIYYPQPAVKLQIWADRDISRAISDTLKSWAQAVGLVIGYVRQETQPLDNGFLITTTWTTPLPTVGELIAEGIYADLEAAERKDREYSHDETLFAAINERKRQEPNLLLLQLYAEAQFRDLPILPCGDGTLIIGTGAHGWKFDPAVLSMGMSVDVPWDQIGTIPVVAVTGTNGKTTTVRLIAHIMSSIGRQVGRTDTDGIFLGDQQIEDGDWAGWGGARRVLSDQQVDIAVLETSRGGILRRGLGFDRCDVSVVTNLSEDHLGELGVESLDQMAYVKGIVVLATKPDGYVVLNADDSRVLRMQSLASAPVVLFSRNLENPVIAAHRRRRGPIVLSDGEMIHIDFEEQRGQIALADVPITVDGAALHNVENVLAATAVSLSLGLDLDEIRSALCTFVPDATHNPNRLNIFKRDGVTVIFDYAHNEAGIEALLQFGKQLQQRSGKLLMILGGPGDRSDEQIRVQGLRAGAVVDQLFLHEEERYLRGRQLGETTELYRQGASSAGLPDEHIQLFGDEVAALEAALAKASAGDVVLVVAHAHRAVMLERLNRWQAEGRE